MQRLWENEVCRHGVCICSGNVVSVYLLTDRNYVPGIPV